MGQDEDYSLGHSISDRSEKLLQKDRGKVNINMLLVKGKHMQSNTYFCRRFLLATRSTHHLEEFSAFLDTRRCKNWVHKIRS